MQLTCLSSLAAAAAIYPPLRVLPRAAAQMSTPQGDNIKVTIRAPSREAAAEAAVEPVFVAKFSHVKKSLSTFLDLWLMGGCGAEDWAGLGELEARHTPSGTQASIRVDVDQALVSLVSSSAPSSEGNPHLGRYATALLDELQALAKTEDAKAADRLCYPPEAVDTVRMAAWAYCAPREGAPSVYAPASTTQDKPASPTGEQDDGSEFHKFLRGLK